MFSFWFAQRYRWKVLREELEGQMAQALAQVQGVMNAVSAGALGAGNVSGGAGGHIWPFTDKTKQTELLFQVSWDWWFIIYNICAYISYRCFYTPGLSLLLKCAYESNQTRSTITQIVWKPTTKILSPNTLCTTAKGILSNQINAVKLSEACLWQEQVKLPWVRLLWQLQPRLTWRC